MIKHNGVYWYWKEGAWCRVLPASQRLAPSRWPASYQRATCARCRRRLPDNGVGRFCSEACARVTRRERVDARRAQRVGCLTCGAVVSGCTSGPYCHQCYRRSLRNAFKPQAK